MNKRSLIVIGITTSLVAGLSLAVAAEGLGRGEQDRKSVV